MEQQEISLNKKYTYRNGEPARILCVDGGDKSYPVIAITIEGQTSRHTKSGNLWDVEGEYRRRDLIEVKEKKELWLNVYKHGSCSHPTKESADTVEGKSFRLARIKVEYVEGQFDE